MAKSATTVSEAGMTSTSRVRDWEVSIDPTGESGPDTLEMLLADYAACAVPAFRVGAEQRGVDDLGHLEIEVTGELNDDDKLESVSFEVAVETELGDGKAEEIIERVEALCKVHDALKADLHADISLEGGAF
ncbi:MAG: OsmC family protein [Halobacteriales archaeon]